MPMIASGYAYLSNERVQALYLLFLVALMVGTINERFRCVQVKTVA